MINKLIDNTYKELEQLKSNDYIDVDNLKQFFLEQSILWKCVIIKLINIYIELLYSVELLDCDNNKIKKTINNVLKKIIDTDEYKKVELDNIEMYANIINDSDVACKIGIIDKADYDVIVQWAKEQQENVKEVYKNITHNFKYINMEYILLEHYFGGENRYMNGLSNDTKINEILDKIYENSQNYANIIEYLKNEEKYYERKLGNTLQNGNNIDIFIHIEEILDYSYIEYIINSKNRIKIPITGNINYNLPEDEFQKLNNLKVKINEIIGFINFKHNKAV